jgi:rhomboid protease GluP
MSHIEPSWGFVESQQEQQQAQQPPTDAPARAYTPVELNLPIAQGSRLRKRWGEVRARSYENKGTVHVNDQAVTIRTSVSRLFRAPLHSELIVQREDIYNVRIDGRCVQFDLVNGPGELDTIVLRTHNRDMAKVLADALPTQMTRTYATETRTQLRFLERINTRTPHAWATLSIVAIATFVYLAMLGHGAGHITASAEVAAGSNFGPYTQDGQWWRLLTSAFLHAGFFHLFFNMLVLVRSGMVAERLFGTGRFIALYVFSAITGSLISLLWHPGVNSVGASGAIFGVLGAIVAFLMRHGSVVPRALYLRHLQLALAFIVYALPNGFRHHGVDNGAHLGGLFGGFLIGLVLAPSPDESTDTRERRMMSLGLSATLACGLIGGMIWGLGDLAKLPERRDTMQFSKMIIQSIDLEKHAFADVTALAHFPSTTEGRAQASSQIRGTLVPEWQRLYDSTEAVHVPPGSADEKTRKSLLAYYGDTLKLLTVTANMIEAKPVDNTMSKALVELLVRKVDHERAEMVRRAPK